MEHGEDARRGRCGGAGRGPSDRQAREVPADPRLEAALAAIDRAHGEDPERIGEIPRELDYAERMTRWTLRLAPAASEPLQLASRGQHLRRWEIPRGSHPMNRKGYHDWRKAQAAAHARAMAEILRASGYDDATIARVGSILRKEGLGTDAEVQVLEDAACLVFLERDFAEFSERHDEEKVLGILRKTWKKMSDAGQAEARRLAAGLPADARARVAKALA